MFRTGVGKGKEVGTDAGMQVGDEDGCWETGWVGDGS